jgi:CHAT domain-containing protein/tetratricopeptide (TPR) repeat protein
MRRAGVFGLGAVLTAVAMARGQPVPLPGEMPAEQRERETRRAAVLNRDARVHREQGRLAQAQRLLEEVVAIHRRLYPDGHHDLASSLTTLGLVLQQRGHYDRAEPVLREALALRRRLYPAARFPSGHPDLAHSINYLALLLHDRGDFALAERLYRECLAMRRRLYPADRYPLTHPDLAHSANNLALLFLDQGDYDRAEPLLREAVSAYRALYPPLQFPQGQPLLAAGLCNLGVLVGLRGELVQSEGLLREALAMRRRLFPAERFPRGHADLAMSLSCLGTLLKHRGDYSQAERFQQEALAVRRRLYPAEQYPHGHPDLIYSLENLSGLLKEQGEYERADRYSRDALAMCRQLFPADRYPRGHLCLAGCLCSEGALLQDRGSAARAEPYFREAAAMLRQLCPPERCPRGHPLLADCLNNLACALGDQGKHQEAETLYREALDLRHKLYPLTSYPHGHADLANGLINLARALENRGADRQAELLYCQALAMNRKLYPTLSYPRGHPLLVHSMVSLGSFLQTRGDDAQAEPLFREGLVMGQQLFGLFAGGASEAEALNFLANLPDASHGLLATSACTHSDPARTYGLLWRSRAAVARLLQSRQQALARAADADTRRLAQRHVQARQELAGLLLAPAAGPKQGQRLQRLTEEAEDLERQLAARLPRLERQATLDRLGPEDLCRRLPAPSAVLDFVLYWRAGHKGANPALHYAVFLLQPDRPIRRVELGPATAIDAEATRWWRALAAGRADETAAARLRRLVWAPVVAHLAEGTSMIWLVPDGALTRLPWAALPGSKPGTVLLEQYALAALPHAPFLLEQLTPEGRPGPAGSILAVGGVAYAEAPRQGPAADARAPAVLRQGVHWPALPATAAERARVLTLARAAGIKEVAELAGPDAGTQRVLAELPRARWAHLATHGFFADPSFRSALQVSEDQLACKWLRGRPRRFMPGARNPLGLSGLVLAGAALGDKAPADGGILTGQAIAGLSLDNLELAVLSACETGLGEVAGGEGVFGLQRAFHIAGCKNVIASLWQVDDEATAALMSLFYHHLWVEQRPPLEALRQAQLTLYRHPERIGPLARARGPAFDKAARLPASPPAAGRAPARLWAGFVLSGPGR